MYQEMCDAMGQDASEERPVEFNLTDDRFINNYFKILHKPYEDDGVGFWWIDWQQGTQSQMAGLDPLWALNHYHYLDNSVNHDIGLILSRYCEAGSHRYPLGFSADTAITYKTLNYLPYFTATASNIGYTWWSHDIGGHHMGYTEGDLFLRSVQYGIFNPIMRLHSTAMETTTKEPWAYPNGYGALVGDALRYRHSLIPYIYSEGVKVSKFGKTLIEPLYYEYPNEKCAYKYKNEYFFGEILVNPITTPAIDKSISSVKAWVPEGVWTDIFTGDVYKAGKGGKEITLYRFPDSIPAFAKAGSTIVLSGEKHTNDCSNPKNIIFEIYSGNGSYDLYEDDGDKEFITTIKNVSDGKTLKTEISFKGDSSAVPANRNIKVRLKNVYSGKPVVYADGKQIEVDAKCDDYVEFIISDIDYSKVYTIEIAETPLTKLEYLQRRFKYNLQRFECPNWLKEDLYKLLINKETKNGCLLDMETPIYDGTVAKLREICANLKLQDGYIRGRHLLKDHIPKRMTMDQIFVEKLCECAED
jgi:alpha-glucosidase (family GH31 glycosyl hydrolase)